MRATIKFLPNKSKREAFTELVIYAKSKVGIKPFVVTQDIKKGDEVVGLDGEKLNVTGFSRDGGINVKENILPIRPSYLFKILGEVSPEAAFVEDGMKYETNPGQTYFGDDNKTAIYKIKCPCCKTFK